MLRYLRHPRWEILPLKQPYHIPSYFGELGGVWGDINHTDSPLSLQHGKKKYQAQSFLSLTCEVHHCHLDITLSKTWTFYPHELDDSLVENHIYINIILYCLCCRDCHQGAREKRGAITLISSASKTRNS